MSGIRVQLGQIAVIRRSFRFIQRQLFPKSKTNSPYNDDGGAATWHSRGRTCFPFIDKCGRKVGHDCRRRPFSIWDPIRTVPFTSVQLIGVPSDILLTSFLPSTKQRTHQSMYEGDPISTSPTKEERKFWKSGDLFLNIVSFKLDTLDTAMLQLL